MAEYVTIHAFVRAPYDSYVHDQTRFWNASGVSVKLGGTGVDVQMESLRALLLGGIAFETPVAEIHTAETSEDHVFPLFADREAANAASYTRKIPADLLFLGLGQRAGARGRGHGARSRRSARSPMYASPTMPPRTRSLAPVRFEVEPERVVGVGKRVFKTDAEAVQALLKQGLRASLQSASLITGQQKVALDFVPDAPPAEVSMEGRTSSCRRPTAAGSPASRVRDRAAQQGQHDSVRPDRQEPRRHPQIGQRRRPGPADEEGADGARRR